MKLYLFQMIDWGADAQQKQGFCELKTMLQYDSKLIQWIIASSVSTM